MYPSAVAVSPRRYDLDWLRVLAFGLLIFYHTGMFFVRWDWHIKNETLWTGLELPMIWVNRWRMPLLFMVSGMALRMMMARRGTGTILRERSLRLLGPLVFGILVIVPPQVYCERLAQGTALSFPEFYRAMFTSGAYPAGNLSWHHLWYLVYIWAYSVLGLPVWRWLLSARMQAPIARVAGWFSHPLAMLVPVICWHALIELLIDFPVTHNFIQDWENHAHSFSLFAWGFVIASHDGFRLALMQNRRLSLYLAGMSGIFLTAWVWLPGGADLSAGQKNLYELLNTVYAWSMLCAIFGYAARWLNRPGRALAYATRAVYPFYILHQTVIVLIAFPLMHTRWPVWAEFSGIAVATFLLCWLLFEGIRRTRITRILFGMLHSKSAISDGKMGP